MKVDLNSIKTNLFMLAVILILLGGIFVVYAAVDTTQPYHDASHVRMTDDRSLEEVVTDLEARISDIEGSGG